MWYSLLLQDNEEENVLLKKENWFRNYENDMIQI